MNTQKFTQAIKDHFATVCELGGGITLIAYIFCIVMLTFWFLAAVFFLDFGMALIPAVIMYLLYDAVLYSSQPSKKTK